MEMEERGRGRRRNNPWRDMGGGRNGWIGSGGWSMAYGGSLWRSVGVS